MADFYQSSLFDPTAPSEYVLDMLKKSKMIGNNKCKSGHTKSPKSPSLQLLTSRIFIIKNNNNTKASKHSADGSEEAGEESKSRRGKFKLRFKYKVPKQQLNNPKNLQWGENSSPESNSNKSSPVIRAKLSQDEEKSTGNVIEKSDGEGRIPRKMGFYQNIFQPKETSTPSAGKSVDTEMGLKTNTSRQQKLRHVLRNVFNARWTNSTVVEDRQILVEEEEVMGGREEVVVVEESKKMKVDEEVKERKMEKIQCKEKEEEVEKMQKRDEDEKENLQERKEEGQNGREENEEMKKERQEERLREVDTGTAGPKTSPGTQTQETKDQTFSQVSGPTHPTTKKKRLRTKAMYRVGGRVGRSLSHGCHYLGHGLANMTTYIPDAAYLGPVTSINRTHEGEFIYIPGHTSSVSSYLH